MNINEIDIKHIEHLTDIQLSKLLHTLLQIELQKNDIQGSVLVPFNITTGDGGDDGRVQWDGGIESTKWLKQRFCIFQNKATTLGPTACYEEILKPKIEVGGIVQPRQLKDRVEELIDSDGCYILFTNKNLNSELKAERILNFRRAIEDSGKPNFDTIQIEVYDSNTIKDWVNENISTVTLVQGFNDISRPGFRTWDEWQASLIGSEVSFKTNEKTIQNINAIIDSVKSKKPIRIIGHSGIGKTRLVLEAFRSENDVIEALRKQTVYFEIGINGELKDIANYITSHTRQNGILVVDSCDETAHTVLSGLVKTMGEFSLITIDIASETQESQSFKVDRINQKDIVREIIKEMLGESHGQSDIDYLNNVCEGYPWMAVRFCKTIKETGIDDFTSILPREFIVKLLFNGIDENRIEYNVIRACAVFSTFGFLDDELRPILDTVQQKNLEDQSEFIRTNVYSGQQVTSEEFYEICKKYKDKDIIEKRGTQYMVKPTTLAITLATDWLSNTPPAKIESILTTLKGAPLAEKFVERLKDLDQADKAQQIVQDLWGPNSPFGTAEVLNTSWGSLLFRYVVEVNPIATSKALQNAFGQMNKQEISQIIEGRRNLVWSLEKLCFRKDAFPIAAKILMIFAVSENETWGNNATNQFIQLFQLALSGTEANLQERLEVIKYGLSKKDSDFNRIIVLALGRSLFNNNYTRMGGADQQGSGPRLRDNEPIWSEVLEFWQQSITILLDIALNDELNKKLAKEKLVQSFRTLIRDGEVDLVVKIVTKIQQNSSDLWGDALNALKSTIQFEKLNFETLQKVELVINSLKSEDIKDQLFLCVTEPEWFQLEKYDKESLIDRPRINAEKLANRLINEKEEWLSYLPNLLQGEQRQAFNFGRELGKIYPESERSGFINFAFESLDTISEEKRNIELIGGFIVGADNDKISSEVLEKVLSNLSFNRYAFYLMRLLDASLKDLNRLFEIIDGKEITVGYFKSFQYGRALEHLLAEETIELCKRIAQFGNEGRWTALSLIFMYSYSNEDNWKKCKDYVKELISSDNMIVNEDGGVGMESYHWSNCVEKLLNESEDIIFAEIIANQILEFCSVRSYNYSMETYIRIVISILIEKYFNSSWPILGKGLIGNSLTFLHLKNLLGPRNGSWEHPSKLFTDEHNVQILQWMRENKETAPKRIANMMPLLEKDATEVQWHSFTKSVIDEFGDQKSVLNELSANMGTFGSVGSSVPYYERQKRLLELLLNHPLYEVKEWAERMIEYTNNSILREKLNDEENSI
ncbi:hypothetical protein [Fluviicola taffensis]|uniref:Uncharacterized protein n=1 Tax=Fluviicola taffensis (strain DSM 16823 / NCIMB 13979 / RW262) TaxID=755732 RepID=F2I9R3_FLUTR|nr:hypothetical protein [Fluviicola taffensis]AEA43059.1 hypothetical protein Fluta_1061 [Fluviicola taffensis DSM 16823]